MRDVAHIWNAWRSGVFVGDTRPCTRVTVEKSYWLRATPSSTVGQWTRGPARWYQRDITDGKAAAGQVETEIPNIVSVSMNRSIDSDAGTCSIVLQNTNPLGYGEPEATPGQYGDHGHFTWNHGDSQDAKARWGHVTNAWNDVLVPNALIRTYQGFGGHDKPLDQALADGNIVLNGVWLVDTVSVTTDGTISLECRDMAKLLVDQQLYPPLVPAELYPLLYRRWKRERFEIETDPPKPDGIAGVPTSYGDCGAGPFSSTDATYGEFNTGRTGHRPTDAFDISNEPGSGAPGTIAHQRSYWLSEPKGAATDSVWIDLCTHGADVNGIYVHPWAGNYLVLVSIFQEGEWVPPEFGGGGGITPSGVPYVSTFTTNWEGGQPPGQDTNIRYLLRGYKPDRVRLTFTNLALAPEGGYRAGLRKVFAVCNYAGIPWPQTFVFTGQMPQADAGVGYWQARANGKVYAFGDARTHPVNSPHTTHMATVLGMTGGNYGYATVDTSGRVVTYGNLPYYGDAEALLRNDIVDIAMAPGGVGYYLLTKDGSVLTYGDAQFLGDATVTGNMPSGAPIIARSIETHPTDEGYWVLLTDGTVQAFGLPHHGNAGRFMFRPSEYVASLRRTSDGGGYWITSGSGIVQPFGNAPWHGNGTVNDANWVTELVWDLIPNSDDTGYAIQHANGRLETKGNFLDFGDISEGSGEIRVDAEYKDYTDIIRDLLLWSGFHLNDPEQPATKPAAVYGNLETTGAHSGENALPREMFDKVPVIDAIRSVRDIVGYVFFVDAEGAARFESPNWWTMGNYKTDGTPFPLIPEIDETVQLTTHSINFSAAEARSEIVIATQDPLPAVAGQEAPKGVLVTRRSVPQLQVGLDLKGMIIPALWFNGNFLKWEEQQTMLDLIAMRMWFSRRQANVTCVANPLIEINDQVRVIERQTGEVYIHYVRGIDINHDLESGDFSMNLTTHWLGGSPYGKISLYFACAALPQGGGYWQCNAFGTIYPFGDAQVYERNEEDPHTEWVISMRSTPSGEGYYTLDLSGKIVTAGDAVHQGSVYSPTNSVKDMALTPSGNGYWILLRDGTVVAFGDAAHHGNATPTGNMPSGSPVLAESIEAAPSGYWVLLSNGTVQTFGGATHHGNANRTGYTHTEYTSCLRSSNDGGGYWIISGGGDQVQAFGNAPHRGNGSQYPDHDWVRGLTWDMLVFPDDSYGLQHAGGELEMFDAPYLGEGTAVEGPTAFAWALTTEDLAADIDPKLAIPVTHNVMKFLAKTGSPSANNAVANNFNAPSEPTIKALTE